MPVAALVVVVVVIDSESEGLREEEGEGVDKKGAGGIFAWRWCSGPGDDRIRLIEGEDVSILFIAEDGVVEGDALEVVDEGTNNVLVAGVKMDADVDPLALLSGEVYFERESLKIFVELRLGVNATRVKSRANSRFILLWDALLGFGFDSFSKNLINISPRDVFASSPPPPPFDDAALGDCDMGDANSLPDELWCWDILRPTFCISSFVKSNILAKTASTSLFLSFGAPK